MIIVRDIRVNIRYHSKNIRNLNLKHNIRLFMMVTSGEVFVTSAKNIYYFRVNIRYLRGMVCHLRGNNRYPRNMILYLRGQVRYLRSYICYLSEKIR